MKDYTVKNRSLGQMLPNLTIFRISFINGLASMERRDMTERSARSSVRNRP